jgi:2-polyprenyl-3-methyl-5-hydroxy-6-metoxy-1,4-benzoquinol methylase
MKLEEEYHPSPTPKDFHSYETSPYQIARCQIIQNLMPAGNGRLAIDIGCGPGFFCQMLSDKGWETTAIDLDTSNLDSARRWASKMILGDVLDVLSNLPSNEYEFALALEIIEHMPKSYGRSLLTKINRILKPGGKLLLSTPNKFSLEGLNGHYLLEKVLRRGKWNAWDNTHVHIYSSPEIIKLLKDNGYCLDKIVGFWYETGLPVLGRLRLPFQKTERYPFNRFGFKIILSCTKN